MRTLEPRAMSGFIVAVLVAIAVQLFQSADDWWPMGRKIFGALLVLCVGAFGIVAAEDYISADGNLRAVLVGSRAPPRPRRQCAS